MWSALTIDSTIKLEWTCADPCVVTRVTNWTREIQTWIKWTKTKEQVQGAIQVFISTIWSHQQSWEFHICNVFCTIYFSFKKNCICFIVRDRYNPEDIEEPTPQRRTTQSLLTWYRTGCVTCKPSCSAYMCGVCTNVVSSRDTACCGTCTLTRQWRTPLGQQCTRLRSVIRGEMGGIINYSDNWPAK